MSIRPHRENREPGSPATPGAWPSPVRRQASYRRIEADPRLTEAIRGLWHRQPHMSARGPGPRWLLPVAALATCLFAFAFVIEPASAVAALGALLLVPFAGATGLRLAAAIEVLIRPPISAERAATPPAEAKPMPSYAVLVPLYDEAAVLPQLVASLARLDYPADRLDLLLVLESRDAKTRQAAAKLVLPVNMRIVVVPQGGPRTKPKALNYALTFVTAELVVVYDAEDRPEPGQLRAAIAAFARAGRDLACVQARLNIYNPAHSLITRQFAIEYSALFDGLLPALERLGLPIPLGGTSNHFRMAALRAAGAWDPYNVTEDADLGIRLTRMGYRTANIDSTTWEEAPQDRRIWLGQRTRWLKGWLQTWLVHMRQPLRLLRDLGLWQFAGLQLVMGGVLLSALIYPVALLLALWTLYTGELWGLLQSETNQLLWQAGMLNLVAGMMAPAMVAAVAVVRRRRAWLLPWIALMPVYWLAISIAGYRALVELVRRPFHWEKTRHGMARPRKGRQPPTRPAAPRRRS